MNKKIILLSFMSIALFAYFGSHAMADMTAEELSDECVMPANFTFSNESGKTIWVALYNNDKIFYSGKLPVVNPILDKILFHHEFEQNIAGGEQFTIAIWNEAPQEEQKLVSSWLGWRKSLTPAPNITHTFKMPKGQTMKIIFKDNVFEHKAEFIRNKTGKQ